MAQHYVSVRLLVSVETPPQEKKASTNDRVGQAVYEAARAWAAEQQDTMVVEATWSSARTT